MALKDIPREVLQDPRKDIILTREDVAELQKGLPEPLRARVDSRVGVIYRGNPVNSSQFLLEFGISVTGGEGASKLAEIIDEYRKKRK